MNFLLKLYKESVKNLPLLKYSWTLICSISILAIAGYLKLKNSDVFIYAIVVLFISFLSFALSLLLNIKDKFMRFLMYTFLSCLIISICTGVLSFGYFIIKNQPSFYKRWFPDLTNNIAPEKATYKKPNINQVSMNSPPIKPDHIYIESQIDPESKKYIAERLHVIISDNPNSKYSLKFVYPREGFEPNDTAKYVEYQARFKVQVYLNKHYLFDIKSEYISQTTWNTNRRTKELLDSNVNNIVKNNKGIICKQLIYILKK